MRLAVWASGLDIDPEHVRESALAYLDTTEVELIESNPSDAAWKVAQETRYREHGQRWRSRRKHLRGVTADAYDQAILGLFQMLAGETPSTDTINEIRQHSGADAAVAQAKHHHEINDPAAFDAQLLLADLSIDTLIGAIQSAPPETFAVARAQATVIHGMLVRFVPAEEYDPAGLALLALSLLPGAPITNMISLAQRHHADLAKDGT